MLKVGCSQIREKKSVTIGSDRRYCVILPAYQEEGRVGKVVAGILKYCPDVIVVDDGSIDATAREAENAGAVVVVHEKNKGKGGALVSGFKAAVEREFEFVITMDSDGQHDPADIAGLIAEYDKTEKPVIIGSRMDNPVNMPFVRRMTNKFMSWLLSRKMGQLVPDTQSGFRLYKCDVLKFLNIESDRFTADSEFLLNLAEAGVLIGAAPIKVIYGDEKSKISPVKDTIRFFNMLSKYRKKRNAGT